MSDEKIDKLENSISELVNITGNLVKTVGNLVERQDKFTEQQTVMSGQIKNLAEQQTVMSGQIKELAEQQTVMSGQIKNLTEQQIITSGRVEDVAGKVLEMKQDNQEFRRETNENFEKLRSEWRVMNRKVEWTTNTSLDAQKRVEDLEVRVAHIEERIAA